VLETHATDEQQAFLTATVTGAAVDEVGRLRAIAIGSWENKSTRGISGTHWFEAATGKIDLMRIVEDRLGADLRALTAAKLRAAQVDFNAIAIVVTALLATVLGLSYAIIRGIVGPVTAMTEAMGRLARGDRSVEIDARERRDEIGEMAAALDIFKSNAIEFGDALEMLARHAKEQNRLLLESMGEGIYGLYLDGRVTFANPAAARMVGYTVEELVDQPIHDLTHHSRPDGAAHSTDACPMCAIFVDSDVLRDQNDLFWRKDGASFPIEYTRTPIIEDGAVAGAVIVFRDVTERRRAEEDVRKLSRAVEQSPVSVVITDTDGIIDYVNPKFTTATGYTAEETIGRTPRMLSPVIRRRRTTRSCGGPSSRARPGLASSGISARTGSASGKWRGSRRSRRNTGRSPTSSP
jgi:PAS domain S-box-containing protein